MGDELFRSEAVESARDRLGNPIDNFGLKSWIVPVFLIAVFSSAACFIATAKYAKRETVFGEVIPAGGVIKVAALRAGTVKRAWVSSGAIVQKGQPLFSISYDPVLEDGEILSGMMSENSQQQLFSTTQQYVAKRAQILQGQSETKAKINGLKLSADAYAEQETVEIQRIKLLKITIDSYRTLLDQQYVSAVAMRQKEDQLLQAQQELLQIKQNGAMAVSQIAELTAHLAESAQELRAAEASTKLNEAQLREHQLVNLSSKGAEIVAVKTGLMTGVQAREGDLVAPNQTLALIVPETGSGIQQVVLWLPSRSIGFVQIGTDVRLMFDAFPYQTFGVGRGKVMEISRAPLNPNELPIPIDTKEQMYKVTVALDSDRLQGYGRSWMLMPGMRLSADLVLDEKSLLDWLLDPLLAARQRA